MIVTYPCARTKYQTFVSISVLVVTDLRAFFFRSIFSRIIARPAGRFAPHAHLLRPSARFPSNRLVEARASRQNVAYLLPPANSPSKNSSYTEMYPRIRIPALLSSSAMIALQILALSLGAQPSSAGALPVAPGAYSAKEQHRQRPSSIMVSSKNTFAHAPPPAFAGPSLSRPIVPSARHLRPAFRSKNSLGPLSSTPTYDEEDDVEAPLSDSSGTSSTSSTDNDSNNRMGLDFGTSNTNPQTDVGIITPEGGVGAPCVIKVLGVGGGGGNAVNRMIQTQIQGVAFWAINTDAQALAKSLAPNILNIGQSVTRGLGAGGDPVVGQTACMENYDDIKHICNGADMVFITAGMGGGTGSGAAPVVAEVAKKECGCLTVGVVTKPFAFEGRKRMKQAEDAIDELRKCVDTLIVVSNDKLLRIVPDNTPVTDAFLVADDILRQGVVGISEIIVKTGLVNVDFADVRAVMKDAGTALMGVGTGVGKTRAADAAVAAISSPLLDFPIAEARRIVFNVVGGPDMGLREINSASEVIYENAHEDANIIFGALIDESMGDEVSITVLACDFREDGGGAESAKKAVVAARESRKGSSASSSNTGMDSDSWYAGDEDAESRRPERGPNFYKERRQATRSPLGPDATIEETRVAITRGFKMPEKAEDPTGGPDAEKGLRKRFRGFFRGVFGKSDRR